MRWGNLNIAGRVITDVENIFLLRCYVSPFGGGGAPNNKYSGFVYGDDGMQFKPLDRDIRVIASKCYVAPITHSLIGEIGYYDTGIGLDTEPPIPAGPDFGDVQPEYDLNGSEGASVVALMCQGREGDAIETYHDFIIPRGYYFLYKDLSIGVDYASIELYCKLILDPGDGA